MAPAALAAAALLAAGCSSSGGGTAAGAAPTGSHTSARNPVSMQQVRIEVRTGSAGAHLADGSGKSVYLFGSDTARRSTCDGACASYWPPVLASGSTMAVGTVKAGQLGTVTRPDGRKQITYAGHPLYYYVGDTKAGDVNGQGLDDFGAYWWLLSPTGKALGDTTSSSGSGGNGGW
jgi:predicted lipoprotein with Yx(FWY)xxD motif